MRQYCNLYSELSLIKISKDLLGVYCTVKKSFAFHVYISQIYKQCFLHYLFWYVDILLIQKLYADICFS